ncbi:hypothetical protein LY78DRAFT_331994 [Colletotrichum sublineola]|nr:hypothetical protein LY78DRAFT_331994 [Colletotrichum sublineola]
MVWLGSWAVSSVSLLVARNVSPKKSQDPLNRLLTPPARMSAIGIRGRLRQETLLPPLHWSSCLLHDGREPTFPWSAGIWVCLMRHANCVPLRDPPPALAALERVRKTSCVRRPPRGAKKCLP